MAVPNLEFYFRFIKLFTSLRVFFGLKIWIFLKNFKLFF